ncbi:MAG: S-layer homology domain-containing protein [Thermoanaerobaculaceae bacterium]|nr:S-layer homology domain-containing protein [Thermoanaerobaculaceae bacterium]NLH11447.1 hypothetical protein [Holophagae bacterium]
MSSLAVPKILVNLDSGAKVDVAYLDELNEKRVRSLVLAADRSTQEDCPYSLPNYKGLFKQGDRVFVSKNYLVWFDLTPGDGVVYPLTPSQGPDSLLANSFTRAGALAGWWTLDPVTNNFKYFRTGPHGGGAGGCGAVWAHNELIPGSASPNPAPEGVPPYRYFWDEYSPPLEHTLSVVPPTGGALLVSTFYSQRIPAGNFGLVADGVEDSAGVHYKTTVMKMVGRGSPDFTDIEDGNDQNGVQNSIDTELEYICTRSGVKVVWKFRSSDPTKTVKLRNAYVFLWTAYAQDEDGTGVLPPGGTGCDAGDNPLHPELNGSEYPEQPYGQPMFNQSSMTLATNFAPALSGMRDWALTFPDYLSGSFSPDATWGPFPPGTVVPMVLVDPKCPWPPHNHDVVSSYVTQYVAPPQGQKPTGGQHYLVPENAWLRSGESQTLDLSAPRWQFTSLGVTHSGQGTADIPFVREWWHLISSNEARDGTLTLGIKRQPANMSDYELLRGGAWYSATYFLSTNEGPLVPDSLVLDPAGTKILEPGETAVLRPTWLTTRSASTSNVTGTLSNFTGPAGATYSIDVASAQYPAFPAADPANPEANKKNCGPLTANCYTVSVSDPPTRPALHWDATAFEKLSNGDHALWRVHIGKSFSDVPTSHWAYFHIETLLHSGVTAGCAPSSYCPSSVLTRAEIAVLILAAKHGPGWVPPPATGAVFSDVPASHWASSYIEAFEAEQNKSTSACNAIPAPRFCSTACSPGMFCPSAPVTRDEIAVFLLKAKHPWPIWLPPAAQIAPFADVPLDHWAVNFVEQLKAEGITGGCALNLYCPSSTLTRAEMAVFLVLTFGLLLK